MKTDCCHHLVVCCYSKCTCFSSSYDWEGTRVLKWLVVGVLMYTTCRVGVLSSEISKHSKISPPPSLRSHLTSSPMGVLSGDYGTSSNPKSLLDHCWYFIQSQVTTGPLLVLHPIPSHYWTIHIFFRVFVNRFKAFFEYYSKKLKGMLWRNSGIE